MADKEKDEQNRTHMSYQIIREKAQQPELPRQKDLNDQLHPKDGGITRAQIDQKKRDADADRLLEEMRQKRDKSRDRRRDRGYNGPEY